MGNIVGVINPSATHKILVAAHMDEVGLQITGIRSNGYLTFRPIGGIDILSLYGQQVTILTAGGKVNGIIGRNKEQTNYDQSGSASLKQSDLWIDIGVTDRAEAEKIVSIGDFATFASNVNMLNNNTICSKALDDKSGLFVISQLAMMLSKEKLNSAIYIAGTVQEEIGTRGMAVVANRIKPHAGLVVDVGHAGSNEDDKLKLGNGPALIRNADNHFGLMTDIQRIAKENSIPFQLSAGNNITGGTDSSRLQLFGENTKTVDISIPCKYMHSPCEVVDIRDLESTISLLLCAIKELAR